MTATKLDAFIDEDKLTDNDLKKHRVGGRLVTRREIIRSKKCKIPSAFEYLSDLRSSLKSVG